MKNLVQLFFALLLCGAFYEGTAISLTATNTYAVRDNALVAAPFIGQIEHSSDEGIVFDQLDTVAMPTIEVNPLTNAMYSVAISCADEDASIYFTTDGSTPNEQSEQYTSSFIIGGGATIKAVAIKEGMVSSDVAVYANVGVDDFIANNITVSPNPTDGVVVLRTNDLKVNVVEIYNVEGQLLRCESVTHGTATLNLSGEVSGLYFIRIVGDDFSVVKKINRK